MKLSRYLTEEVIRLEMETVIEPPAEGTSVRKWREEGKRLVLNELVSLLENGSRIGNRSKLLNDFVNREKKATTGIGHGIAIPHIRSLQAKDLMLGFARSTPGYDFEALDDQPVHLFFVMAAPPYDDSLYLKVFKALSQMLQHESFRNELMQVESRGEIIRTMKSME